MPWTTPTLTEVRRTNRDHLGAFLPGADATVPNSALRVLSDQNAGGAFLNLLYLDWLAKELFYDTSEGYGLDRGGEIYFGGKKAATFASGFLLVTGTSGTLLPAGSLFASTDGVRYQTRVDVYLSEADATAVAVDCLTAGAIGNRDAGAPLALAVGVSGIDAQARVAQMAGGANAETYDQLRARLLLRIRNTPMGGDRVDYEQWALEVPGVTRAWCEPNGMGIGTVVLRFMCDSLRASAGGFPQPEDVAAVRAHLDAARPVAVKDLFVAPPLQRPLTVTIRNLSNDTPSTRIAIEKAVEAMLYERAAPGQTIYASWVAEAIAGALGEDHHDLDFANAVMPTAGHMAVLGSIVHA